MKKFSNIVGYALATLMVILACTKEVALVTEVEFELVERHTAEGFVNQGLSTTVTVIPEAELEGYTYSFVYESLSGIGHFEDADGNRIESGTEFPFDPFTASLMYVGEQKGAHRVKVVGSDNFGFTEELELSYTLEDVPVVWTAASTISQIELGEAAPVTVTLQTQAASPIVNYEAALQFVSGSGSLTPSDVSGVTLDANYNTILPGVYQFSFVPDGLGSVEIVFLLRDENGQELKTSVEFEVVQNVPVISIDLGEHDALEMLLGSTRECPVTFNPANATDQDLAWVSSNPGVVSVDALGNITALIEGTATITATSTSNPNATATVEVTVVGTPRVPVTGITVSQEDPSVTGPIRQLIATVLPDNATDPSVTWASSNESIATVDANGLLTGVAAGSVVITAISVSDPEVSGSIVVNITGGPQPNGTDITAFSLPVQNSSVVDNVNHTVTINVADGTNLNVAPAILSISAGSSVTPGIGAVQDFNGPVTYTVTAGNGDQQVWTVNVTVSASAAKSIDSFSINGVAGTITGTAITMVLPAGTNLTSLSPVIAFTGASISPNSGVAQNFSGPVVYTVTAQDGSQIQYTVSVTTAASSAKSIDSFSINGVAGTITGTAITMVLPAGTNLASLSPVIAFTGASISPNSGVAQNFSGPVVYTVTAQDGSEIQYTVSVTTAASSAKSIDSFSINGVAGTITGTAITMVLPAGTNLASLSPVIAFTGASISPNSGVAQNFSGPVVYTVTAQDGSEIQYTVSVTTAASSTKTIDSFSINGIAGTITGTAIALSVPNGTNVSALVPSITFTGASLSPNSGVAQNFSAPVIYTVTAQDGSEAQYTVTVTVLPPTNQAPTAVASANVLTGSAPLTVNFTGDQSSDPDAGDTISYLWNYDDGGNSNVSANPSYTFGTPGTYNVTLTVTDNGTPQLNDTAQLTITVTAANQIPTAVITVENGILDGAPDTVFFNGNDSTDPDAGDTIVEYQWNFGDPGSGANNTAVETSPNTSHTFNTEGSYTVSLVVVDNRGGVSASVSTVVVIPSPNSPPNAVDDSRTLNAVDGNNTLSIPVIGNDTDPDNDPLTIQSFTQPSMGTVTQTPGTQTLLYDVGATILVATGTYTFEYTVIDGNGGSDTATVTVTVTQTCPAGQQLCFDGDEIRCVDNIDGDGNPILCPN